MSVSILLGGAILERTGPFMPAAGISIAPMISVDLTLLHASLPPMASTDFLRISAAAGSFSVCTAGVIVAGVATGTVTGGVTALSCAKTPALSASEVMHTNVRTENEIDEECDVCFIEVS